MVSTTVKNDSATALGIHDIQSEYHIIPPFGGTATLDLDPDDTETAQIWGALTHGGGVVPVAFSATTANGEPMTHRGAQIFDDGKYLYLRAA